MVSTKMMTVGLQPAPLQLLSHGVGLLPQSHLHWEETPLLPPRSLPFNALTSPRQFPHPRAAGAGAELPTSSPEEWIGGDLRRLWKRRSVAGVDQERLLDPTQLADPDSLFLDINGVQIHHKIRRPEEHEESGWGSQQLSRSLGSLPVILLHGFGASVFSWEKVLQPLAAIAGAPALAFDRPAFGLTSRPRGGDGGFAGALNPYSVSFSMLATISFIDLLAAQNSILMGHSAGCIVAVNTYFEAPERVAALILVAPAIVAPFLPRKANHMDGGERSMKKINEHTPSAVILKALWRLFVMIKVAAMRMLRGMSEMVGSLYAKALAAVLRSSFSVMLVRAIMDKFSISAVRNAWFDASRVTSHVVQGYTKPLKVKDWELALLEHTLALLTDSATSNSKPPISQRLSEISCPVLIITGDADRLVPPWNAERLSRAIPGSTVEVIKNCGHIPHEEKAEEFLFVVERFFQRVWESRRAPFLADRTNHS